MDVIVAAGGTPKPEDPLYSLTEGRPKALIDMHGRTMLERVLDALQNSQHVGHIVVVGLGSDLGMTFQRPVDHLPDHGSMVGNTLAGLAHLRERNPDLKTIMFCSADIPTITPEIVDDMIERCRPFDKAMYYNFVTREVLEQRFPHSNRTYVKLKGIEIAGGDMAIAQASLADGNEELFEALTNARKNAWKLARIVGIGFLIKFLLRRVGIKEIEETAARVVNRPAEVVLNPHAEIAMDADRLDQVELLRADIAAREG